MTASPFAASSSATAARSASGVAPSPWNAKTSGGAGGGGVGVASRNERLTPLDTIVRVAIAYVRGTIGAETSGTPPSSASGWEGIEASAPASPASDAAAASTSVSATFPGGAVPAAEDFPGVL